MNELALFAGAGGGILGGKLLGWRTVCAVERDAYAAQVLAQRQNDGMLDPFPVWSDVCSFDGRPWRGLVDIVSGGFPCQDISSAGKGAGIDGARSGLWSEFARIIREVEPRFVFVENSPMLTSRGLDRVLGDLAALGFDAEWGVLGANDAGAPHTRKRIWVLGHAHRYREPTLPINAEAPGMPVDLANAPSDRRQPRRPEPAGLQGGPNAFECGSPMADPEGSGLSDRGQPGVETISGEEERGASFPGFERCGGPWWATEPELGRTLDGLATRVDEH